jgi:hypothetical protein
MNAMLEPRIVAASTHFPEEGAQGELAVLTWMTFSSQGSRIDAITPQSKVTERSTATAVPEFWPSILGPIAGTSVAG